MPLSNLLVISTMIGVSSVTRFGEISPLCQNGLFSIWQHFDGLFSICQNFEPTLAKVLFYWAKFHGCKWPIVIYPSGHTGCKVWHG